MTTAAAAPEAVVAPVGNNVTLGRRLRRGLTSPWATIGSIIIALLWTTPTFGLFISSFRPEQEIKTTGWWTFFANPNLTLQNYEDVLFGGSSSSGQLASYFISSVVITIPAVLFPIAFAAFAAYALAWTDFKGRDWLYVGIFALQIVPLQMALVPLLRFFNQLGTFEGTNRFAEVWFAHTCFALPFGIFLLHNFMSDLPKDLMEAARVDGAGHATIFRKIVLPLIVPALASLTIFQFLWVWNDLLVALIFAPGETAPMTARLAELAGTRGNEWQRLTSGAFISMLLPLIVFLSLQRYFVRGLLAGSVKG